MTKAVIFDLDGVLVDSERLIAQEMCAAFAAHGYALEPTAYHIRFHYVPLERTAEIVAEESGIDLPADLIPNLRVRLNEVYDTQLQAVDGVVEMLQSLGRIVAIASGSLPRGIDAKLHRTGLKAFFEPHIYSVFDLDHAPRKPAPDIYLHTAARLGLAPHECVAIEDAPAGVEAGVAAGMRTLGFTGGGHDYPGLAERLREAGADAVFHDMRLLSTLL